MTNKSSVASKQPYIHLISAIGHILEEGRRKALQFVNRILVKTYWEIGKQIVEFEQQGGEKAEYGSRLLERLTQDLKTKYGRGFNIRNLYLMRQFYLSYKNLQTLSAELSWSHYIELIGIEDDLARRFYEKQCVHEGWSVRELKRQINTALFHRIALSKDKKGVLNLAQKGQLVETTKDILKDPYIFEFLQIPEGYRCSEKELEQKIINNLQMFLLELGKGFTFVGRQHRITLDNIHFYVDLVFYHRILKCFVLIDLKLGKVTHQDIGQMNMYLSYFKKEESGQDDNHPIGIILGTEKDTFSIEYALGGITNQLFVSKYKLYLPDKKALQQQLQNLLEQEKS
ncbi:MAG: PDDEXK nuclease domain-containing protein [Candidatus Woesearchaeota archaeon]|nr:PDDEXK nuclease domain-containing protein [Candidatus Woesearchaeota archaeon]